MRRNNYEYGTTPRKIEPKYNKKEVKTKNIDRQLKINEEQKKRALKLEKKKHNKNIVLVLAIFLVLLLISYRNSLINEEFRIIQKQKNELASIEKTNGQIEVNIQENINLGNIEKSAEEKLGMQKLDNSQKVYITLDKKDYVETITEDITVDKDEENWVKKIINKILGK